MRSIVLEKIGQISCRELLPAEDYKPTRQEEIDHGTPSAARSAPMRSRCTLEI